MPSSYRNKQCIRQLENVSRKKSTWLFSAPFINRTSDFADDFAKSLSNFDEVLLMIFIPQELQWKEFRQLVVEKWKTRIKLVKENVIESILAK
jgi:hypothetical protein